MRKEHGNDVSPETLASMDRALQAAINRLGHVKAAKATVTGAGKEKLRQTAYGAEKVQALSQLGK